MSEEDYERGRASARLDVNDERHKENVKRFDSIDSKLAELASTIEIARGGLRVLFAVGSLSAAMGVFLHWIIDWIWTHVK